jgi:hypothetical protein
MFYSNLNRIHDSVGKALRTANQGCIQIPVSTNGSGQVCVWSV